MFTLGFNLNKKRGIFELVPLKHKSKSTKKKLLNFYKTNAIYICFNRASSNIIIVFVACLKAIKSLLHQK